MSVVLWAVAKPTAPVSPIASSIGVKAAVSAQVNATEKKATNEVKSDKPVVPSGNKVEFFDVAILGSVGVAVAKESVDLTSLSEAAAGLGEAALVIGGVIVAKDLLDGMLNEVEIAIMSPFVNGTTISYDGKKIVYSADNAADNADNAEEHGLEENEGEQKVTQGKSRSPEEGEPDSTYEQVDDQGNVRSKTKYGENHKPEYRDDFDHEHYDKKTGQNLKPHRHPFEYNKNGQPVKKPVIPIP